MIHHDYDNKEATVDRSLDSNQNRAAAKDKA
jgi:hypothetical protein